ncbi:YkvI family membrane protein [Brevibacillus dissolubilis]|uniref:YkvI family membrane protein n=1 Tax=Brevibacillus dissolubilis TaxID=1844116 RepID=UPI001116DB88|nr:hypothetical protein [Brevibacillus dissolubilis]
MQKSWKHSLQIAFTYIGTVVGAGFASGREILEFFVQYGTQGLIGVILSAFLFVWAGVQVMLVAHRIQATSYQEMSVYLFGKTIGSLFNIVLLLVLLGTTSVMLAFTGSLTHETFHLPAQIGIWVSMICIYIVTARGLDAIHSVNSIFVPILIGFTFLVFFYTKPWGAVASTSMMMVEPIKQGAWISSPLYYVALNISLTQAVLIPIGRESRSEKPLVLGGILGGLGISLLLLLSYLSLNSNMPQIQLVDAPMIHMLSGLGKGITILFAMLVFGEVFSSLVANVFGLAEQVKKYVPVPSTLIISSILLISYAISFVGFSSLLSLLYPLFGQIVVFFLFMLLYRQISDPSSRRIGS